MLFPKECELEWGVGDKWGSVQSGLYMILSKFSSHPKEHRKPFTSSKSWDDKILEKTI